MQIRKYLDHLIIIIQKHQEKCSIGVEIQKIRRLRVKRDGFILKKVMDGNHHMEMEEDQFSFQTAQLM